MCCHIVYSSFMYAAVNSHNSLIRSDRFGVCWDNPNSNNYGSGKPAIT